MRLGMSQRCQTRTSRLSTPLLHWSSLFSEKPTRRAENREHTMKLYYLAGSCALAPHIALELSGLRYEAIRVERAFRRPHFTDFGGGKVNTVGN